MLNKTPDLALWGIYQQPLFSLSESLPDAPAFAIITACNPLGQIVTDQQNQQYHQNFMAWAKRQGYQFSVLEGCSPDLSHREVSLVLVMEQQQARKVAMLHKQNAFYFVLGDQLSLEPAMMLGMASTEMGSFRQRLITDKVE